jgi:hypothetical protein
VSDVLDARGRRLRAALAAVLVKTRAPQLKLMQELLDSWAGIGLIVVGMAHQRHQVSLGEHGAGQWIAVFYTVAVATSPSRQRARRRKRRRGGRRVGIGGSRRGASDLVRAEGAAPLDGTAAARYSGT